MRLRHRLLLLAFISALLIGTGLRSTIGQVYSAPNPGVQDTDSKEKHTSQPGQISTVSINLDRDRIEEISQVLSKIEIGRGTLRFIQEYKVLVSFEPAHGTRFYPYRNEIVIDTRQGKFTAAISLIHEATHARYFHERMGDDEMTGGRHEFVHQKLEEEMNAIVTSIEATSTLWETGVDITAFVPPMYFPYKQAYGTAYRAAKSDYPGLDDQVLDKIGRIAGQNAVSKALINGTLVTSVNEKPYPDYWGLVWDLKHKPVQNGAMAN